MLPSVPPEGLRSESQTLFCVLFVCLFPRSETDLLTPWLLAGLLPSTLKTFNIEEKNQYWFSFAMWSGPNIVLGIKKKKKR